LWWVLGAAWAGEPADDRTVQPRVGLETVLPVHVGVRAEVEWPHRLRTGTSVGWLPSAYVDTINGVVVGLGGYEDTTAALVQAAIKNSLVWRIDAGWRPLTRAGLHLDAGYQLVALGGSLSGSEVVEAATGREAPKKTEPLTFETRATLHMIAVDVGYEWTVAEHLWIRTTVGGAFTLDAPTALQPAFFLPPRFLEPIEVYADTAATQLSGYMTRYVHTPTLGITVGWAL
jgi:hypothetical protein